MNELILLCLLMLNPPGTVHIDGDIISIQREDGSVRQIQLNDASPDFRDRIEKLQQPESEKPAQ